MSEKKAIVCGVSGQDGAYLARYLFAKGYIVYGTSRDAQLASFESLKTLAVHDRITLISMVPTDYRSVLQTIDSIQADEVYNLSGQSSVGYSFDYPVETLKSISVSTLNFLEVIRFLGLGIKFYNAGSSEIFGDTDGHSADETHHFPPGALMLLPRRRSPGR